MENFEIPQDKVPSLSDNPISRFQFAALDVVLASGNNDNIATQAYNYLRVTGPSAAFAIRGFSGGVRGAMLIVEIGVAQTMTISNLSAGSTVGNRIATNTGADIETNAPCVLQFVYDDTFDVFGAWKYIGQRSFSAMLADTKDPTGFVDPSAITVAYDATTRKITLTGTLDYYWRGVKKSLVSPWVSDAHNSADGSYYLYTTDGATFAWSTTAWTFSDLMVAKAIKSTTPAHQFALREVHGLMPWQAHETFHETVSAYRDSGGALTAGTYAENTATDAANTPGFDEAIIQDEDLRTTIPAWTQGTYTTLRIGASSKATFDTTATLPFRSSGSYLLINNPADGSETAAATNQYCNIYQILAPSTSDLDSQKYRVLMLQPQRAYSSLASAQAEDPRSLLLGDLATALPEFVVYARITYVTSASDANTGKCRIATGGITYLTGTRLSQVSVGGFAPPTAENIPFTPTGTIVATNVQAAIAEVGASGTAFPASPIAGDLFFRTDLGLQCYYDGTRWLTVQEYFYTAPTITFGSTTNVYRARIRTNYAIYITRLCLTTMVLTTNDASNYWQVTMRSINSVISAVSNLCTAVSTAGDTVSAIVNKEPVTISNATPANYGIFDLSTNKTGSPGTLQVWESVYYRYIIT
jgi:hypothetical protein